jgi:hypothetical protein
MSKAGSQIRTWAVCTQRLHGPSELEQARNDRSGSQVNICQQCGTQSVRNLVVAGMGSIVVSFRNHHVSHNIISMLSFLRYSQMRGMAWKMVDGTFIIMDRLQCTLDQRMNEWCQTKGSGRRMRLSQTERHPACFNDRAHDCSFMISQQPYSICENQYVLTVN